MSTAARDRNSWDKKITRLFISLYKQHPCLYDPAHPDFNNKIIQNEKFELILKEMQVFQPELTVANLKKKIRTLQAQLAKERANVLTSTMLESGNFGTTGGAPRKPYVPTLWCYNDLMFLNQCNEPKTDGFLKTDWNREHILMLIKLFKPHPCLYNRHDPDYKNKEKRSECYFQIWSSLREHKPGLTLEAIRNKYCDLKNKLAKEKLKQRQRNADYVPTLWCYNELEFLRNNDLAIDDANMKGFWNRELTLMLIELYKQHSCLYNTSDPDYKNVKKRCENYDYIFKELKKQQSGLTLMAIRKKLSTLRSQLHRENAKILAAKEKNSDEGDYVPKLWCYNELEFLNEFSTTKTEPSDIDQEFLSDIDQESESSEQDEPSQSGGNYRVRNILTLEERVRAIEAYDRKPMYTKVASMFNCSWEQIKNVIQNRKAIMDFYQATRIQGSNLSPDEELIRRRKVAFLGECMYEYIQRAQFHANAHLNEEIIRAKATEFREIMQIENFVANRAWLNQFKIAYNISFSQRQILLTRTPPASLDLKSIMTYCSRNGNKEPKPPTDAQTNKPLYKLKTTMDVIAANTATLEELRARRQRKINFLEKALYEYIQRAQFHHKMPLNEDLHMKVAYELRDMLKIDNFVPNRSWFKHFKLHYNFSTSQRKIVFSRIPPFSLDLKDILSYCSRMDQKNANASPAATTAMVQRENAVQAIETTPPQLVQRQATIVETQAQPNAQIKLHVLPPQTIIQKKVILGHADQLASMLTPDAKEFLDAKEDIKPNIADIKIELPELPEEEEKVENEAELQPPAAKLQKLDADHVEEATTVQSTHSPGHWSDQSSDDEELPKHAKTYRDALRLLKPLEEFAMLQENYRAIGLISQLENIFKNPPTTSN